MKIKALAYFFAYAGALFIVYKIPYRRQFDNSCCVVCYRTTELGGPSCKFHRSGNSNHDKYLSGKKILNALKVSEPEKYKYWGELKKSIEEAKVEEIELNLSFDNPENNWKEWTKNLISFIKSRPALGTRLSIEKIDKFNNWVEIVNYLRVQLKNPGEKSNHPKVVTSWLAMAAEWIEFEDMFISKDGNNIKKAKGSVLSPRQLFLNEFLVEQNFDFDKIALKLEYTRKWVKRFITSDEELLEIYLKNKTC